MCRGRSRFPRQDKLTGMKPTRVRKVLLKACKDLSCDKHLSHGGTQIVEAVGHHASAVAALSRRSRSARGVCLDAFRLATDQSRADQLGCGSAALSHADGPTSLRTIFAADVSCTTKGA
jgi:hypothetical protein